MATVASKVKVKKQERWWSDIVIVCEKCFYVSYMYGRSVEAVRQPGVVVVSRSGWRVGYAVVCGRPTTVPWCWLRRATSTRSSVFRSSWSQLRSTTMSPARSSASAQTRHSTRSWT